MWYSSSPAKRSRSAISRCWRVWVLAMFCTCQTPKESPSVPLGASRQDLPQLLRMSRFRHSSQSLGSVDGANKLSDGPFCLADPSARGYLRWDERAVGVYHYRHKNNASVVEKKYVAAIVLKRFFSCCRSDPWVLSSENLNFNKIKASGWSGHPCWGCLIIDERGRLSQITSAFSLCVC